MNAVDAEGRGSSAWRSRDYRLLWCGHAQSELGTQITMVALPLIAVVVLDASAGEVSLIAAARYLPFLVLSVAAGVYVDRVRRRPLLLWTDVLRAVIVFVVPAMYFMDSLNMETLVTVAFAVGALRVVFDIAHQAFLPSLVLGRQLVSANSALAATSSTAAVAGPGVGGLVIHILGAAGALLADVASFLISALTFTAITSKEQPVDRTRRPSLVGDFATGFRFIVRDASLMRLLGVGVASNMALACVQGLFFVITLRKFGIPLAVAAALLGAAGVGGLAGSLIANRVGARFGAAHTLMFGYLTTLCGTMCVAFAIGGPVSAALMIGSGYFVWSVGTSLANVVSVSYRQLVIPTKLLGRVGGAYRTFLFGSMFVGSLLGGAAAELFSLRAAMLTSLALSGFAWLLTVVMARHDRKKLDRLTQGDTVVRE